jgi:AcrR family transcriptional regulator
MAKIDGRTTDTKQRILREAKRMYLKGGYTGISLEDLAIRLEITKPALFHHYKSKQELFYEVLLDLCDNNEYAIKSAVEEGADSRSRLRNILLSMRQQPFFDPMKFLNEELEKLDKSQQEEINRRYYGGMQGPIQRVLEEGVQNGELRPHNTRVGAMAFSNLMMLLPSPGNPVAQYMEHNNQEEYIDELLQLFFDGVINSGVRESS